MTDPYRTRGERPDSDEPVAESPSAAKRYGHDVAEFLFGDFPWGIVFMFVLFLGFAVIRACAEIDADQTRRAPVCMRQGQKNAEAWAAQMRLKDPTISCLGAPCGGRFRCSVRSTEPAAVYGIECLTGDGDKDVDGVAGYCFIAGSR